MSYVIRFHLCRSLVWLSDIFASLYSEKAVEYMGKMGTSSYIWKTLLLILLNISLNNYLPPHSPSPSYGTGFIDCVTISDI